MKRSIARVAAAAVTLALPLSLTVALPAAQAAEPEAPVALAQTTPNQKPNTTGWRDYIRDKDGNYRYDNVKEIASYSPSMKRDIPLVLIQPKDPAKRAESLPTLYLLNGADGGEGSANWFAQTDLIDYYGDKGVNVVVVMAGAYSYYTDWQQPNATLDGGGDRQNWETFLTKELPEPLEKAINGNGRRAIAGLSMSATSTLNFAEHNPGFYNAVGSFSGCAATTGPLYEAYIDQVLNRGGATYEQMWGPRGGDVARNNDALLNAEKLRGQHNIYVSNSTGLAGEMDLPSGPMLRGKSPLGSISPIVEGGFIEASTNACTHDLEAKTRLLGITPQTNNIQFNFRPAGTHQWGYWRQDMRDSWPVLSAGLFG
ncbi:alpha/beta hydrolase [Corynebacterium bovis]|uniref:S-formylglutathione hydrolase FrmB n=1 Tax=Corynebacterium bovis DSM 20582 = CIP 54.80 TaxID=927655 RepID=A0A8H9Y8A4_9CORY|nr:alpha/beta hydrolase family protein [Corynebacterium bovis]MBB3116897.1 S-formylglutathione hydrolase FrmB [Corynebacterium bovis DSM 20582 = CIP 54.80]QQC47141.1 esterase family protein [Corynebacterium bovis]RRO79102.1 esterase family protein [Corynebacterium bovis]RRO79415.1 esterase family protein [Corynebacterium bovis]RRO79628.1 esterase family protein [Corynebacterium bovis]